MPLMALGEGWLLARALLLHHTAGTPTPGLWPLRRVVRESATALVAHKTAARLARTAAPGARVPATLAPL